MMMDDYLLISGVPGAMSAIFAYVCGMVHAVLEGGSFLWRPDWLVPHAAAHLLTVLAGLALLATLLRLGRRGPRPARGRIGALLALFLAGDAVTHLLALWRPLAGLRGLAELATSSLAIVLAAVLWRFLPRLPILPAPPRQRRWSAGLEAEIERRVRARTHDLEAANAALRRNQERLAHLATHDGLTGLPNRRLFHELLLREHRCAARHGRRFALLLADLDGFKRINDGFGHVQGDAVLVEVARRLRGAVRASDIVARLGGDEFAILMGEPSDARALATLMQRLVATVAAPMTLQERTLKVGVSIGAALFAEDATDPATLLERADLALYAVKAGGGRAGVARFRPDMRRTALPGAGLALVP